MIDQEVLFWTLSTIAQTYGAILAFIGALSIFKIQYLRNKFNNLLTSARDFYLSRTLGEPNHPDYPHTSSDDEFYDWLQEKETAGNPIFSAKLKIIKEQSIPKLIKYIVGFSILNILIISFSLLQLLLIDLILKNTIGLLFFGLVILLCFSSLILSVMIIKYCLKV